MAGLISEKFFGQASPEMFAEVVYTMCAGEVAAWCRSLNLRGIELPDQIKDEVMMLMNDAPGQ